MINAPLLFVCYLTISSRERVKTVHSNTTTAAAVQELHSVM